MKISKIKEIIKKECKVCSDHKDHDWGTCECDCHEEVNKKIIKTGSDFRRALQKWHLERPTPSINFEDNFPDTLREKWQAMDKAILEVIWEANKTYNW